MNCLIKRLIKLWRLKDGIFNQNEGQVGGVLNLVKVAEEV
jgi:hypothetical protein